MDKVRNILQFAMDMERQGQIFFEFYAEKVNDENIKTIFEELAEVEKDHHRVLKEKYDEFVGNKGLQEISWVIDDNAGIKSPDIFTSTDDIISLNESLADVTVLRMAYIIEHDFEEFYRKAAQAVDEVEVKEFLLSLADWEQGHKELFYSKYKEVKLSNWEEVINYVINK